jgi:hypothetical protein
MLSFLTCGLQYRYYTKTNLPSSTPVQIWFGQFIHGIMEEAYLEWKQNSDRRRFPWSWNDEIHKIETTIFSRLAAGGLTAPPNLFCQHDATEGNQYLCPDASHPHKLIASQRAEAAINTWGQHLFPIIGEAEVRLKGIRDMPNYQSGVSRCNYYEVTGIIDVISSVQLKSAPPGNLILHQLQGDTSLQNAINNLPAPEYEIIVDYKGMRRPPSLDPNNPSSPDPTWEHHKWQILTYAWLRSQQQQSKTIIAGILLYLNELAPSISDLKELQVEVLRNLTEVMPSGHDDQAIRTWKKSSPAPTLTTTYKEARSIRVIPVDQALVSSSLLEFDNVVAEIEQSVLLEKQGKKIPFCWRLKPEKRNCTACNFKTYCPKPAGGPYHPRAP